MSDNWGTPPALYEELDEEFHFDFDPCPYPRPDWDGLLSDWGASNFVNPPYSSISKWAAKCRDEQRKGNLCVLLIPSRTETNYFHRWIYPHAELRFIRGRLYFTSLDKPRTTGKATFPSMICVFRP